MSHPRCGENIEVFYLVAWIGERIPNPVDLTRRFAESYLRCPAGANHRLTLIFKGFQNHGQIAEHCSLFDGTALSVVEVPDVEQDIGLYRVALERSGWDFCCVLNSYSIICVSGWLADLVRCARDPRVGIVGATGSYESHFSDYVRDPRIGVVGATGSYQGLFDYGAGRMAGLAAQKHVLRMLRGVATAVGYWAWFPRFPNPTVRTNAFMISRDVFQRVRWPRNPSRMGALRFESGRRSLTRQVLGMGLEAVIVGRDGRCYGISEWPSSCTFRQKEQQNLLVADNRTIDYSTAAPERRRQLAAMAWGTYAAE